MVENRIREAAQALPGHWMKCALKEDELMCAVGHLRAQYGLSLEHGAELCGGQPADYTRDVLMLSAAAVDKFPDRSAGGVDDQFWAIMVLNDAPETTESEILSVMELAADRWDVEKREEVGHE